MTTVEIIAQIVGVFGVIALICMYHFKDMKSILKVKMVMDVLWGVHYFLLGAMAGFATNLVCLIRETVFLNNNKKFFASKIWLLVFVACNIVSACYTWKGLYSILPALASILATFSFWQKNVTVARTIGFTNNILMVTYDIFVHSYMGIVGESLAFASVMLAMYKNRKTA